MAVIPNRLALFVCICILSSRLIPGLFPAARAASEMVYYPNTANSETHRAGPNRIRIRCGFRKTICLDAESNDAHVDNISIGPFLGRVSRLKRFNSPSPPSSSSSLTVIIIVLIANCRDTGITGFGQPRYILLLGERAVCAG